MTLTLDTDCSDEQRDRFVEQALPMLDQLNWARGGTPATMLMPRISSRRR